MPAVRNSRHHAPAGPGGRGRGATERLAPGLRRVRAPNPGPLTGSGTNSYLVGSGCVAVIDPGPDDPAHLAALEAALAPGERIGQVIVTHAHRDHSALAPRLAARWGAPVAAFGDAAAGRNPAFAAIPGLGGGEGVDAAFAPDRTLADGAELAGPDWRLRALWTPGHMGNHLCLIWQDAAFSGDHVMGWATSIVSPPDGDMAAYMASLDRLAAARPRVLYPGHGDPVADPAARIAELAAHRRAREAAIRARLGPAPQDIPGLTRAIYAGLAPALLPAAERNVLAHLLDLCARGVARSDGPPGPAARFRAGPAAGATPPPRPGAHGPDPHGPDADNPDAHNPDAHNPDAHNPNAGPGSGPDAGSDSGPARTPR